MSSHKRCIKEYYLLNRKELPLKTLRFEILPLLYYSFPFSFIKQHQKATPGRYCYYYIGFDFKFLILINGSWQVAYPADYNLCYLNYDTGKGGNIFTSREHIMRKRLAENLRSNKTPCLANSKVS